MKTWRAFKQTWCIDAEFFGEPGARPNPVCLVARELNSGREVRLWRDELLKAKRPPYPVSDDVLFVAFYSSAEWSVHLALGWPLPRFIVDCFAEFRNRTNGIDAWRKASLLNAIDFYGLDNRTAAEKSDMIELILTGGPWSSEQRRAILNYCADDVDACVRLFLRMRELGDIDLPSALWRGRFMAAAARMEHVGIPLDRALYERMLERWPHIQGELIRQVDSAYGCFEGTTFKLANFERYLRERGIPWPRTETGRISVSDDVFREQAKVRPEIAPLHELRGALSQMRSSKLAIGRDGFNRVVLGAYGTVTGRCAPSGSRYIFGPSVWQRGLIKPPEGMACAYVDFSAEEFGIGAVLSQDTVMLESYRTGDPYLDFAKRAKAVPETATKVTHGPIREQYKATVLGVGYGLTAQGLARRLDESPARGRELINAYATTYRVFWNWCDAQVGYAFLSGKQSTCYRWNRYITPKTQTNSARNWPMQAHGSELLRLACCELTEQGVAVAAPVHDALLVLSDLRDIDDVVATTKRIMGDASERVLVDLRLRTDAVVVKYPDRFMDPRGERMWQVVTDLLRP